MLLNRARNMWRIVREVDLDAIRRTAECPVAVTIIGESLAEAHVLAALLGGEDWQRHEELAVADLAASSPAAGTALARAPVGSDREIDLAVLVARAPGLSPALAATRNTLIAAKVPVVAVVTGTRARTAARLGRGERARVAVEHLDADAIPHIAVALFEAVEPDVRLALARQFPVLQGSVFNTLIDETARANAGYSFGTGLAEVVPVLSIPANIGDIFILTKNQLVMSYRIALAAGKRGRPRDVIGEIVGVLGGSLLFRQVARELIGLVPVLGIVPKVAVAYGGTWAIGRAVVLWATEGEKLSRRSFRNLLKRGVVEGRRVAGALTTRTRTEASDDPR
jgi:uncharacterized protein (DUF697 family)